VSGVAHEINNPNNFMLLNSNNLADIWLEIKPVLDKYSEEKGDFIIAGLPYSELRNEVASLISGIAEGSERIRTIVQNLKNFARQDPGNMDELVDLNKVIGSSVIILSNVIKKSTDYFRTDMDEALPMIKGNFQQVEQVIINLISNACQALSDKTKAIVVSTFFDKDRNRIILEVKDEGQGIEEIDLKHIIDPFFTTKRETGGTGLGLSISYGIIKEHKGNLSFKSKSGKGTVAQITFPSTE